MKDLCLVLIGGLCAAFGGFVSTWYQAKRARKIKMEETIGEQKVEAYKKALSLISQLRGLLITGTHENGISFMKEHHEWFSNNIILLPHTFVENWQSIRVQLLQSKRRSSPGRGVDEDKKNKLRNEVDELVDSMDRLAEHAEMAIRSELGLPQVKVQGYRKSEQKQ